MLATVEALIRSGADSTESSTVAAGLGPLFGFQVPGWELRPAPAGPARGIWALLVGRVGTQPGWSGFAPKIIATGLRQLAQEGPLAALRPPAP